MTARNIALIIFAASLLAGCDLGLSSANVSDIKTCKEIKADEGCENDESDFRRADTKKIYVTAQLNNVPEGAKVKFDWRKVQGPNGKNIKLPTKEFTVQPNQQVVTYAVLPGSPGEYEVSFSVLGEDTQPVTKTYNVK